MSLPGCTIVPGKDELIDPDGDGWGWPEDCDSSNPAINPSASDAVDGEGLDQNCDGVDGTDGDGDGVASEATGGLDCDDADGSVHPDAVERCDGVDNDCDGTVDEGDAEDASTWYADADGDGHGEAETEKRACSQPEGYVASSDDCDDLDGTTYPAAVEVCKDWVVNDCDSDSQAAWEACGLTGTSSLSDADRTILGEHEGDQAAHSVVMAGDVDGDGLSDLLVGAHSEDAGGVDAGASYLLLGAGGLASGYSPLNLADADLKLVGESSDDESGWHVSGAGDVDGDGRADVLVGARYEDSGGSAAGAAYLVFASSILSSGSVTMDLSAADLKFIGETTGDLSGYSVSSAGDLDGDGRDEVLVGALYEHTEFVNAGAAYLILGSSAVNSASTAFDLSEADLKFTGEEAYSRAGASLAQVGDLDGDGLVEFVVSAYGEPVYGDHDDTGAVYIFRNAPLGDSPTTLTLGIADLKLVGEAAGNLTGGAVAGVEDVDGDGRAELIVGAHHESSAGVYAGAAYLLLGGGGLDTDYSALDLSVADLKLTGEAANDQAGVSVSSLGDFDGDGSCDVVIGANGESSDGTSAGASYLLLGGGALNGASGTLGLASADAQLRGAAAGDTAGRGVSGGGDVDGDGLNDFIVGANGEDSSGTDAGAAYLLFGRGF